jgi:hypothetical protein
MVLWYWDAPGRNYIEHVDGISGINIRWEVNGPHWFKHQRIKTAKAMGVCKDACILFSVLYRPVGSARYIDRRVLLLLEIAKYNQILALLSSYCFLEL